MPIAPSQPPIALSAVPTKLTPKVRLKPPTSMNIKYIAGSIAEYSIMRYKGDVKNELSVNPSILFSLNLIYNTHIYRQNGNAS